MSEIVLVPTFEKLKAKIIDRTPNPDCPYCQQHKLHWPISELIKYHADAGTGVDIRDSRKAKGQA